MKRRTPVWIFSLCIAACGGATASETHEGTTGSESNDTHEPADPALLRTDGTCTAATCTSGQLCVNDAGWQCDCREHVDVNCGGAYREPGPSTWGWECAPNDRGADRGDGCPFGLPAEGSPCTTPLTCRYPADQCGYDGVDAVCAGATWRQQGYSIPPPP